METALYTAAQTKMIEAKLAASAERRREKGFQPSALNERLERELFEAETWMLGDVVRCGLHHYTLGHCGRVAIASPHFRLCSIDDDDHSRYDGSLTSYRLLTLIRRRDGATA